MYGVVYNLEIDFTNKTLLKIMSPLEEEADIPALKDGEDDIEVNVHSTDEPIEDSKQPT